ncbi:hypothetical protein GCM10010387_15770 [Streptomyces inusitatus]|uniref:Uncharacterized protein n=1 Tax=Streptomyces inusitatus TaxID=68221 RepID=A0A918PUR3_9ACTN|nr:hypothetical protein [Streptomyces inusitatus]GGZ23445.1 hypothetical protein GCM10010387_15770 [Streptomyces inusitatus]
MTHELPFVQFRPYGPDRFAAHLPFGRVGHLFTVPGSFPADTPAHTNVTDWEMATYRSYGEWEVRDVNGNRRVWGTGPTRRAAVGLALLEIARKRRERAADIAEKRVKVLGLEPVPPFAVEVTGAVTLVLSPQAIGILRQIQPSETGPARYAVNDVDGGEPYDIRADDSVTLRTTQVGVFHDRCGHDPEDAYRFENQIDAEVYARHALSMCWPCSGLND